MAPVKLRVGVFADARLQPRWIAEAFANAARSGCAEVVVLEADDAAARAAPWRLRAYRALDRWAFGPDCCDPVDLIAHVPHENAAEPDLDVAFAVGELDDTALDGIARLGVWRLRADGACEVAAGEPVSGAAVIVRLAAGEAPRIACESWARTYPLSVARNRRTLLAKAAELPARALREARLYGRPWLEQCRLASQEKREVALPVFSIGSRILRRALDKATGREQWGLAFGFGELMPDLGGFTRIAPPGRGDWAHPFALERQGRYYVFFTDSGRIAMLEIDAAGRWSAPRRVLERDYPLSHPFLLEHEDALYMIPEAAHAVELYRCVDFPRGWKLERVLLGGVRLVDATVHRGPDRWWMFANAAAGTAGVCDELHLFHAPRPQGEWQPHRRNPVKSDARSSRPAGRLYWRAGSLYRPAQICAPRFGAGLSLNRVLRLSPEQYAERQVTRVLPAHDILGLHTLNRAGALTVVDYLARRAALSRSA